MGADNSATYVYLIGHPVGHSASPAIHNTAFLTLGLHNWRYKALDVTTEELEQVVQKLILSPNCAGANVTIPHKQSILKFVEHASEDVKIIGATNTIVNRGQRLYAYNTDWQGFLMALDYEFGRRDFTASLVFGSGGAARAVVYGLIKAGVQKVYLSARNKTAARILVQDLSLGASNLQVVEDDVVSVIGSVDLVVNATPVGLHDDQMIFDPALCDSNVFIYDLVYKRGETPLVDNARRIGLKAASGASMLLFQGGLSLKLWTGFEPPYHDMQRALKHWIESTL